jgi:hypothetical protein
VNKSLFTAIFLGSTLAAQNPRALLDQYCAGCHNQRARTAGLALDTLDIAQIGRNAETWEKVVARLRSRTMPPSPQPKPDAAASREFVRRVEAELDWAAQAEPGPARRILHRLNRTEYANAIRDLLDLEVDASSLLPPDDAAYGFDNISEALGVSPSLQERYLAAAAHISALAVGDPRITPASTTYRIRQDLSQNQHIEGLPLGTIGGLAVHYNFPLDGEYILQAKLYRTNLNIMRGLEFPHQVEFTIAGERVHLARIGGNQDLAALFEKTTDTGDEVDARLRIRLTAKAGPATVTAAFLEDPPVAGPARLQAFLRSSTDNFDWTGWPHIQTFSITGPFNATGSGDTPARRRIFVCRPENPSAEGPCARRILAALARRAYRKPVSETELARILAFYESGRRGGSFEAAIQVAVQRILASPNFVFRTDDEPASRLSFFLWSSIPDDDLLEAAGKLNDPAVRGQQVKRMLADPKSRALTSNFAGQWLRLRNLRNVQPNSDLFPDFDENLRQSLQRETELLFESILRENRSALDLLSADYTFLNERLARHYGIPGIYGSQFRRVGIKEDYRRGLLGHGSILAVNSYAERTSPVLRGKWILENLLGLPVPQPPADVPPLRANKDGEKPRSMREQMLEHRVNAVCASCHKVMDPVGLALENFDAVGAWRTHEGGSPIDASGELADGTKINGVVDLRSTILNRPEEFVGTLTQKLLTYALGRGLDYRDMPAVRKILREAAPNNYRLGDLIMGIAAAGQAGSPAGPELNNVPN